jgi:hypothetical protein
MVCADLAEIEQQRKASLEASVRLLVQHYAEWRALFPYFAKLPDLGAPEFGALDARIRRLRRARPWHRK